MGIEELVAKFIVSMKKEYMMTHEQRLFVLLVSVCLSATHLRDRVGVLSPCAPGVRELSGME